MGLRRKLINNFSSSSSQDLQSIMNIGLGFGLLYDFPPVVPFRCLCLPQLHFHSTQPPHLVIGNPRPVDPPQFSNSIYWRVSDSLIRTTCQFLLNLLTNLYVS